MRKVMDRMVEGYGRMGDLELLLELEKKHGRDGRADYLRAGGMPTPGRRGHSSISFYDEFAAPGVRFNHRYHECL